MAIHKHTYLKQVFCRSILIISMLCACMVQAQEPGKDSILVLGNDYAEFIQEGEHTVHKLMHDVKMQHGSDTLYCDSAFFYTHINSVEAFGDVVIRQADGTEAFADYMRYTGNNKQVFMRAYDGKEVQLVDAKGNSLWSREITYNMHTKIGTYSKGGQLQNETTVLISDNATYNLQTKEARFVGHVVVTDPEYNVISKDLGYNTETKVVRFFGPSRVINEESILHTSSGTYATKEKQAHFNQRSSILNQAQYIEADTLDYDRVTGFGIGRGNVISIDTTQKTVLFSGYVQYNEITKVMLAYIDPVMKKMDGKDSLFLRSDTFYSAPILDSVKVMSAQDSLQQTAEIIQGAIGSDSTLLVDSLAALGLDDLLQVDSQQVVAVDTISELPDLLLPMPDSLLQLSDSLSVPSDSSFQLLQQEIPTIDTSTDATGIAPDMQLPLDTSVIGALKKQMDQLVYPDSALLAKDTAAGNTTDTLTEWPQIEGGIQPNTDTSGPRYFIAYPNVLIWSDSLQGKCDSLRYTQDDSLLVMYKAPVLWPRSGQMNGDVIIMKADTSSLREIIVPKNGIMINRSGPEQAAMFDQVQGNTMHAYLTKNEMDSLIAEGNAASIYFVTEEDSAYVGSSEATAERIEILFEDQKIDKIYYRRNVDQKMTPMKDVEPDTLHLNRFLWLEKERPKSMEAFLNGRVLPPVPELPQ